jgi:hypothetical protein
LPDLRLKLPIRHPGQEQIYAERKHINVAVMGRRWGKTLFGTDLISETVIDDRLPVGWFAPSYKDLAQVWREVKDSLRPIITDISEQEHYLQFVGGGTADFWSLDNPDSGRGRKYRRVIVDEAGKVKNLEYAWSATVQPTLTDYEGDAWLFGTPKGMNYLYQLYLMGQNADDPDFKSWQMPTWTNPHMTERAIERMRRTMPALMFAQEVEAQFIDDGSGAFRNVISAVSEDLPKKAYYHGTFAMGVDWGQSNDYTVVFVIDVKTGETVDYARFTGIDWALQRDRIKGLYLLWKPAIFWAERNSIGQPNIEQLLREGIVVTGFQTNNQSKQKIVQDLALAFELAHITIPAGENNEVVNELLAFQIDHTPTGLLTYRAPEGMHDDVPMALAIAWAAAKALGAGWNQSLGGASGDGIAWREFA